MANASDIRFIKKTFNLSDRQLANVLGVAPYTVERWLAGPDTRHPTGTQNEALDALYRAAERVQSENDASAEALKNLLLLGVGALILKALFDNLQE